MEPVPVNVGDLGPWAGALASVWAIQQLGALVRAVTTGAAELAAIRRGLGLPAPEQAPAELAPPFSITITRAAP